MTRESRLAFSILAAVIMTLMAIFCMGFGANVISKGPAADHEGAPPESGYVCVGFGALLILASVIVVVIGFRGGRKLSRREADEPADILVFDDDDIMWWRGQRVQGLEIQQGVIVLRPEMLAFLPVARSVNAGASIAGAFGGAIIGVEALDLSLFKSEPDVERWVADLWRDRHDDFDSQLQTLSRKHGGRFWSRPEVMVSCSSPRSAESSRYVSFTAGRNQLHGRVASSPNLDRLLIGWARGSPSIVPVMMLLGVIAAVPTLASLLCLHWWRAGEMPVAAPITWGVFAAVTWSGMILVFWLSRRRVA